RNCRVGRNGSSRHYVFWRGYRSRDFRQEPIGRCQNRSVRPLAKPTITLVTTARGCQNCVATLATNVDLWGNFLCRVDDLQSLCFEILGILKKEVIPARRCCSQSF